MESRRESAAAALVVGLLAGVAGTAAMTAYQSLVSRIRDTGSKKGSHNGRPDRWKDAPAPAQIGRLVLQETLDANVPLASAPVLATTVHWGYGIAQGAGYGALRAVAPGLPGTPSGLAFGAAIWGMSYAVLPRLDVYEPITAYPPKTLALDLSYHLVYGLGVAASFSIIGRFLRLGTGNGADGSG